MVKRENVRHARFGALLVTVVFAVGGQEAVAQNGSTGPAQAIGVNLGIADDETYGRPNSWSTAPQLDAPNVGLLAIDTTGPASRPGVSIAWRNAQQIEEVEVRVQNLGTEPGEGRVYVEVLDETGRLLLHLEPPDELKIVRLPAVDQGGLEGKVIRMSASRALNNLIDQFDRTRTRYDVRATIETIGHDIDLSNNSKTKSWNIPFAVQPGLLNAYNYVFQNHDSKPVLVRWQFEHTPLPPGWVIEGLPSDTEPFWLQPGQQLRGTLLMRAPMEIEEGAFLESRLSLVEPSSGLVLQQREWFQVYDTIPPHVSNYRLVYTDDYRLAIQVLVADQGSGVMEATGVTTEYSTDGGRTWSQKAHNYKAGNFVRPTLFETVLGPFNPGTDIQLRITALDTAGNAQTIIPDDAVAAVASPSASELLESAYVFPRTQPNPIFEGAPFIPEDEVTVIVPLGMERFFDVVQVAPLEEIDAQRTAPGASEASIKIYVPLGLLSSDGEALVIPQSEFDGASRSQGIPQDQVVVVVPPQLEGMLPRFHVESRANFSTSDGSPQIPNDQFTIVVPWDATLLLDQAIAIPRDLIDATILDSTLAFVPLTRIASEGDSILNFTTLSLRIPTASSIEESEPPSDDSVP